MPEYILENSSNTEYKYVVFRGNSVGNGSCWRAIFHSNNKSECEKFINKEKSKDSKETKSLLEQLTIIAKRKHKISEKYKERMKYVKSYRDKMEEYYE